MAVKGTKGTNNLTQHQQYQQQHDCRQYYTLGTDSFEEDFECDEPVDVPIERLKLTLKEEKDLQGCSKRWALVCVILHPTCLWPRLDVHATFEPTFLTIHVHSTLPVASCMERLCCINELSPLVRPWTCPIAFPISSCTASYFSPISFSSAAIELLEVTADAEAAASGAEVKVGR